MSEDLRKGRIYYRKTVENRKSTGVLLATFIALPPITIFRDYSKLAEKLTREETSYYENSEEEDRLIIMEEKEGTPQSADGGQENPNLETPIEEVGQSVSGVPVQAEVLAEENRALEQDKREEGESLPTFPIVLVTLEGGRSVSRNSSMELLEVPPLAPLSGSSSTTKRSFDEGVEEKTSDHSGLSVPESEKATHSDSGCPKEEPTFPEEVTEMTQLAEDEPKLPEEEGQEKPHSVEIPICVEEMLVLPAEYGETATKSVKDDGTPAEEGDGKVFDNPESVEDYFKLPEEGVEKLPQSTGNLECAEDDRKLSEEGIEKVPDSTDNSECVEGNTQLSEEGVVKVPEPTDKSECVEVNTQLSEEGVAKVPESTDNSVEVNIPLSQEISQSTEYSTCDEEFESPANDEKEKGKSTLSLEEVPESIDQEGHIFEELNPNQAFSGVIDLSMKKYEPTPETSREESPAVPGCSSDNSGRPSTCAAAPKRGGRGYRTRDSAPRKPSFLQALLQSCNLTSLNTIRKDFVLSNETFPRATARRTTRSMASTSRQPEYVPRSALTPRPILPSPAKKENFPVSRMENFPIARKEHFPVARKENFPVAHAGGSSAFKKIPTTYKSIGQNAPKRSKSFGSTVASPSATRRSIPGYRIIREISPSEQNVMQSGSKSWDGSLRKKEAAQGGTLDWERPGTSGAAGPSHTSVGQPQQDQNEPGTSSPSGNFGIREAAYALLSLSEGGYRRPPEENEEGEGPSRSAKTRKLVGGKHKKK